MNNAAVSTAIGGTGSAGVKRKAPAPRKASPTRQGAANEVEESTFNDKLAEIKKLRSAGVRTINTKVTRPTTRGEEPVVPKQVKTATGVKTFLKTFESWIEVVSGSGKIYYYNKKTRENQWKKPQDWVDEEMRLNPPIPAEEEQPPIPLPPVVPDQIPLPQQSQTAAEALNKPPEPPKLTIKLKTKKKVNKVKKKVSKLPAAYQPNRPDIPDSDDSDNDNPENKAKQLTLDTAFESVDDDVKPPAEEGGGASNQQLQVPKVEEGGFGHMKPAIIQAPASGVNGNSTNSAIKEKKHDLKNGTTGVKDEKDTSSATIKDEKAEKIKDEKAVKSEGRLNGHFP
jgi:hypothetical protein